MNTVELIERKRDGGRLTDEEIAWLIASYTEGTVPEYQMAAMAMAVFLQGLGPDELAAWTSAMLRSGEVLDFSDIDGPKVDKHSTGGVGDKVSLPLAPMAAASGLVVPMISGRGLGHTGGTLDKLESIPGFRTALTQTEFHRVVDECGFVMAGQSESLAPADRKLYALRDATGTVPSIPLIVSSIMSKKLAEGLDALVLDVKVGVGAFMQDLYHARTLAETMVQVGGAHSVPTVALVTSMDAPLGDEVGNASEVRESLAVLRGEGPDDLVEVTMALGTEMLLAGGVEKSRTAATERLRTAISSGAALETFGRVIEAQGGDPRVTEDDSLLPLAERTHVVESPFEGTITTCHARRIGIAAMRLGAGRARKEDTIDPGVGITVHAKPGDRVEHGTPLATLRYRHPARLDDALVTLRDAWQVGDGVVPSSRIVDRVALADSEHRPNGR